MNKKLVGTIGILGISFFCVAAILGGLTFADYDPISQYISETYAAGTPYGEELRFFGYIPSGILLTIFFLAAPNKFPKSAMIKLGFWGLAVFYGLATVLVAIFPCDIGCNRELIDPTISQLIHNLVGASTYLFVPVFLLLIGIGLRLSKKYNRLSVISFVCALNAFLFVIMLADPLTMYAGLYQRIIEGTFVVWIIICSIFIKNSTQSEIVKSES